MFFPDIDRVRFSGLCTGVGQGDMEKNSVILRTGDLAGVVPPDDAPLKEFTVPTYA